MSHQPSFEAYLKSSVQNVGILFLHIVFILEIFLEGDYSELFLPVMYNITLSQMQYKLETVALRVRV